MKPKWIDTGIHALQAYLSGPGRRYVGRHWMFASLATCTLFLAIVLTLPPLVGVPVQAVFAQAPTQEAAAPARSPVTDENSAAVPASQTALLFENQQYAVRVFKQNGQAFANVYDKQSQTHKKLPVSITPAGDPQKDPTRYVATIGDQQYTITVTPRGASDLTIFKGGTVVYRQSSNQITIARALPEVSGQPALDDPTRDLVKTLFSNFAKLTLFTLMLSMGLRWKFEDVGWLWQQPSLLLRSLFSVLIAVPLLGAIFTLIPGLTVPEKIAIGAMVACPGAPTIPFKSLKSHGYEKYVASLQFTVCILAIISVPLVVTILAQFYPNKAWIPPLTIARQIFFAQVLPLGLGVLLSQYVPKLADELVEPIGKLANFLFLLVAIVLLVISLEKVLNTPFLTILVMGLIAIASLVCGHFLGGPRTDTRATLAYATATRNAGLAFLLVSLNFPNLDYFNGDMINALVTYALIAAIVAVPYTAWRKSKLVASLE